MKLYHKLVLLSFFLSVNLLCAQENLSHEIGISAGPVTMQTDYGERHYLPSSTLTSFGLSFSHYLSFYGSNYNWRNGSSFFSDHFKLKTDFSLYFNNNLEHKGKYVEDNPNTQFDDKLRAMKGTTKLWDVGTQLEFYFLSLEDYGLLFNNNDKWAPYVGTGVHYSKYTPTFSTSYGNGDYINNPEILPDPWQQDAIFLDPGYTFSWTFNAGTRYKLGDVHVFADARFQYFFSDKIEGLDAPHDLSGSKFNDTIVYFSVGVIYDLGSFSFRR
ncbi:MAG: outer membrane beta-barrel protein [Flavobacteriaceae bacterium]|nr:outer membrane beta-barrel protein [Flavobacteriaceae bacterium]